MRYIWEDPRDSCAGQPLHVGSDCGSDGGLRGGATCAGPAPPTGAAPTLLHRPAPICDEFLGGAAPQTLDPGNGAGVDNEHGGGGGVMTTDLLTIS